MIAAILAGGGDAAGATFTVDSGLKDLRTMAAEGRARGMELPLVERAAGCYEEASKSGWGPRDGSAVAAYWSVAQAVEVILCQHLRESSCNRSRSRKPRPLLTSRSSTAATIISCRSRWRCSTPAAIWSRYKREDKSGILRFEIAFGKAWGALGMGLGSRTLAGRAPKQPAFFTSLAAVSGGRLVPGPGGVLIRDKDGDVIGACRHLRRRRR